MPQSAIKTAVNAVDPIDPFNMFAKIEGGGEEGHSQKQRDAHEDNGRVWQQRKRQKVGFHSGNIIEAIGD